MAISSGSSLSWVATSTSSSQPKICCKPNILRGLFNGHRCYLQPLSCTDVGRSITFIHGAWRGKEKVQRWKSIRFATSGDSYGELKLDASDAEHNAEDIVPESIPQTRLERTGGKPDFLILFFTEALFYSGVAVFLLLIDYLRRPCELVPSTSYVKETNHLGHRISSVTVLVLSLIIPMVTMGLVWPWTGPAASATLAPYLVGIVVQFAFEQYAQYRKSPSWPIIPIIFQVYRLHQLNRAAQLVTALSFTVRGAETTPHNLSISSSLGTLLNVLQFLGVICIWSLSSFLMRSIPSATVHEQ
ncbi:uncharacterized protein LOC122075254 isoform X3 [Macadamia integrifolia]|uniref:uncharacterized protein LOC122075254 isoform X3 n=1 Tax=Macadamia integrifolia TaxID=60698 RepID=UPI001C4E7AC2|nr:uncharacterized protein LOC122075254 isoform X3 [Macadamia integrifolia]